MKPILKNTLTIIAIILGFAAVIVFWPRTYCGRCGHLVEPGISIMCSHCGNLLTDTSYVYSWWMFGKKLSVGKEIKIENINDKTKE